MLVMVKCMWIGFLYLMWINKITVNSGISEQWSFFNVSLLSKTYLVVIFRNSKGKVGERI